MKRLLLAATAILLCAAPVSAAPANLTNFDSVDVSGRLNVDISIGPNFSVDISGPHTERVEARVRGSTLEMRTRDGWFQFGPGNDANVHITMPALRSIGTSAGVEVNAANVRAENLSIDSSSGSDLNVSGQCASLTLDVSSGAEVRASSLRCGSVQVDASSGASASVYASQSASVDASSGADITLMGEGRLGDVSLSSGGELHHR